MASDTIRRENTGLFGEKWYVSAVVAVLGGLLVLDGTFDFLGTDFSAPEVILGLPMLVVGTYLVGWTIGRDHALDATNDDD